MQLVASGRIVRSAGRKIGVQTIQHEFRTTGIPAQQRNATNGTAVHPPPLMTAPSTYAVVFAK